MGYVAHKIYFIEQLHTATHSNALQHTATHHSAAVALKNMINYFVCSSVLQRLNESRRTIFYMAAAAV